MSIQNTKAENTTLHFKMVAEYIHVSKPHKIIIPLDKLLILSLIKQFTSPQ